MGADSSTFTPSAETLAQNHLIKLFSDLGFDDDQASSAADDIKLIKADRETARRSKRPANASDANGRDFRHADFYNVGPSMAAIPIPQANDDADFHNDGASFAAIPDGGLISSRR